MAANGTVSHHGGKRNIGGTVNSPKKVPDVILGSLKYKGVFYMQELEIALKLNMDTKKHGLYRQHFRQCLESLALLRKISENKPHVPEEVKVEIPPLSSPTLKTVIFDLDETLIHCNEDQSAPFDVKVPVKFPTGECIEAGINIRPHAKQILKNLAAHFEVLVFTASHSCYANPVIDYLDPHRQYVKKRLFRQNCMEVASGLYVKDLDVLKDRDMRNVVLVDNAAYSYSMQLTNGIPIVPFYKSKEDRELEHLEAFLMTLKHVEDVRPVLK